MDRLDRVARSMNPFLVIVVIALGYLNYACLIRLIDWPHLPETPAMAASPNHAAAPAVAGPRIVSPSN